jgi:uncharacterized protein YcfJ
MNGRLTIVPVAFVVACAVMVSTVSVAQSPCADAAVAGWSASRSIARLDTASRLVAQVTIAMPRLMVRDDSVTSDQRVRHHGWLIGAIVGGLLGGSGGVSSRRLCGSRNPAASASGVTATTMI